MPLGWKFNRTSGEWENRSDEVMDRTGFNTPDNKPIGRGDPNFVNGKPISSFLPPEDPVFTPPTRVQPPPQSFPSAPTQPMLGIGGPPAFAPLETPSFGETAMVPPPSYGDAVGGFGGGGGGSFGGGGAGVQQNQRNRNNPMMGGISTNSGRYVPGIGGGR